MNVKVFEKNGKKIRAGFVDGKPYLVAKDVAQALGYPWPENSAYRWCTDTPRYARLQTLAGPQKHRIISLQDALRMTKKSKSKDAFEIYEFIAKELSLMMNNTEYEDITESEEHKLIALAKDILSKMQTITILEYADYLKRYEGIDIDEESFFKWIVEKDYIDNKKWFDSEIVTIYGSNGIFSTIVFKITPQGQIALASKIVEAFREETK